MGPEYRPAVSYQGHVAPGAENPQPQGAPVCSDHLWLFGVFFPKCLHGEGPSAAGNRAPNLTLSRGTCGG